jgi:hypothetical protein
MMTNAVGSGFTGGLGMMRKSVAMFALGASVLLRLDPVELLVYLDDAPEATSIDTVVAEAACQYIRAEEVPLPVPYTVRLFQRSGESRRYIPRNSPVAKGLLSKCPATLDYRGAHGTALK